MTRIFALILALAVTGCIDGSCRGIPQPPQPGWEPDADGNAPSPKPGCEPSGASAGNTPGAYGIINPPIAHPAPPAKFPAVVQ